MLEALCDDLNLRSNVGNLENSLEEFGVPLYLLRNSSSRVVDEKSRIEILNRVDA